MSVPFDSAIELLQMTIADSKTVDQDVLRWIHSQTLAIIVDGCINPSNLDVFEPLLVPEQITIHALSVLVQFEGFHLELGHGELSIWPSLVRCFI